MSALLASLLAEYWQQLAGAVAAIVAAAGLYLKGRGDAAAKARLKDLEHANDIRKAGAEARDRAAADAAARGLRQDDGWRRD